MKLKELTKAGLIATCMAVIDYDDEIANSDEDWEALVQQARSAAALLVEELNSQNEQAAFDGSDYNPGRDDARLETQLYEIFEVLNDGYARTVPMVRSEIYKKIKKKFLPTSISAQIRNLRKPKHGGWIVLKWMDEDITGKYWYRLFNPDGSELPPVRPDALTERLRPNRSEHDN